MIHASLFSGIGGPEVAAAMLGWENAFHCEINPFGRAVLEYWFPNSESYEDVTKTDFSKWRGKIDVLTAGIPCQPFSYAGKRGGADDERYLWPEAIRVINEIRPTWVIIENVAGIATMVEGGILTDLGCDSSLFDEDNTLHRYEHQGTFTVERICHEFEECGYAVQPVLIPAAAVEAPHRRDRVFFIAFANADRSDAVRGPGIVPRSRGTERLQERDEVRELGVAGELRPPFQGFAEDSDGAGCVVGVQKVEIGERNVWDAGAGNAKRLHREARVPAANANGRGSGEIPSSVHTRVADGDGIIGDGCERDAAYTHGAGREESQFSGREENQSKEGPELDHRTVRPGRDGDASNAFCERLATALQSGLHGSEEWDGKGRPVEQYSHDAWTQGTWWDNFPTVSPVHRGNDGLPFDVDRLTVPPMPGPPTYGKGDSKKYPFGKWRTESLKAYGNAIVPQVMYRIFQAIEQCSEKI